mmetsp:Transcript_5902/g.12037  ORF Transcript_5902/g.12037 Transcript_5902/m.12037 type:complete len:95 (+) Transcript_5902:198-482(+)|eukprot:CAMPEP_0118926180 /NCGR_PEP_ID=MMETSP1169-20130426/3938_1 /TAXON_ID=36882 /ORGANISM="Pyramimonas obovata, Strain CCMP722" /LENGTH=94 /DNA_ID=CAMNT_0006867681 /DNA_START=198 /DNA_END=482 /DNA_ORIENTATION=-
MNPFNRKQHHARREMKKAAQIKRKVVGTREKHLKEASRVGGNTSGKAKTQARRAAKRAEKEKELIAENLDSMMDVEVTKKAKAVKKSSTTAMVE